MNLTDLLPAVQQLPAVDKLRLIRILAEELDTGEDIAPLVPHKVYQLPTPYAMFGAGNALFHAMELAEDGRERGSCDRSTPRPIRRKMNSTACRAYGSLSAVAVTWLTRLGWSIAAPR